MIIFQFSKIINYLLKHQRVDRIIYGFFDGNRRRLIVLDNKKEILNSIAMDYGMADKSQHYWFEANVSGFSIPILKFEE